MWHIWWGHRLNILTHWTHLKQSNNRTYRVGEENNRGRISLWVPSNSGYFMITWPISAEKYTQLSQFCNVKITQQCIVSFKAFSISMCSGLHWNMDLTLPMTRQQRFVALQKKHRTPHIVKCARSVKIFILIWYII